MVPTSNSSGATSQLFRQLVAKRHRNLAAEPTATGTTTEARAGGGGGGTWCRQHLHRYPLWFDYLLLLLLHLCCFKILWGIFILPIPNRTFTMHFRDFSRCFGTLKLKSIKKNKLVNWVLTSPCLRFWNIFSGSLVAENWKESRKNPKPPLMDNKPEIVTWTIEWKSLQKSSSFSSFLFLNFFASSGWSPEHNQKVIPSSPAPP